MKATHLRGKRKANHQLQQQREGIRNSNICFKTKQTVKRKVLRDAQDDDDFMEAISKGLKKSIPVKKIASKRKLDASELVGKKRKRPSVNTRCELSMISELVGALNRDQKIRLIELGFGWVFKFNVTSHGSRDLIEYLMNHFDPKSMFLDLGGSGKLPVTRHAVRCVLDVKDGPLDPPIASDVAILQPIKDGLGISDSDRIYSLALMERIRGGGTDDFTMRCILMILFAKLLAPDSGAHISRHVVNMASMNLEDYANMDLCKFVVDPLRYAAEIWRDGPKSTALACTTFLVVYYLDNLHCKEMNTSMSIPCSEFFNSELTNKISKLDKIKNKDGSITFGKLDLRSSKSATMFPRGRKKSLLLVRISERGNTCLKKKLNNNPPTFGEEQPALVGMFPSLHKQLAPLLIHLGVKGRRLGYRH